MTPTALEVHFEDALSALADARRTEAQAKALLAEARAAFEAQHADEIKMAADATALVKEFDEQARTWALDVFKATGEKKLMYGVEVKMFATMTYDAKEAEAWAVEHKMAMKFDAKAFEKIAKASPLPFVTVGEEPRVTIPTSL